MRRWAPRRNQGAKCVNLVRRRRARRLQHGANHTDDLVKRRGSVHGGAAPGTAVDGATALDKVVGVIGAVLQSPRATPADKIDAFRALVTTRCPSTHAVL